MPLLPLLPLPPTLEQAIRAPDLAIDIPIRTPCPCLYIVHAWRMHKYYLVPYYHSARSGVPNISRYVLREFIN